MQTIHEFAIIQLGVHQGQWAIQQAILLSPLLNYFCHCGGTWTLFAHKKGYSGRSF